MRENIWQLFCSHSASNILPLSFRAHEVGVSIPTDQKASFLSFRHSCQACLDSFDSFFFFFFNLWKGNVEFASLGEVESIPSYSWCWWFPAPTCQHTKPRVYEAPGQVRNRAADHCTDHIRRPEHGTLRRFRNLVVVRLPVSAFPPTLVFPKSGICSLFLLFLGLCNFFRPRIFRVVWLWVIHGARRISSPF